MASITTASAASHLRSFAFLYVSLLLLLCPQLPVFAADEISREDDPAPKSPSCNNKFQLVKIKNWINGVKGTNIVGLSARFGTSLPSHATEAERLPAVLANPFNCCTNSSSKLSDKIALAKRGDCTFTAKAEVAQLGGARGLLVINDNEDLYKMVCTENNTKLDIKLPVVMIPKSAGEKIKDFMTSGERVELLLFSPKRPVIDFSAIFLWLMAVGTIVCASVWAEFIACEQVDERYNHLTRKERSDAGSTDGEDSDSEILEINAKGAIVFVIMASAFLMLLYFFMSSWFIWLLVVLFCIGGTEAACIGRQKKGLFHIIIKSREAYTKRCQ